MLIFVLGFSCSVYGILQNGNQTKIGYSTLVDLTFIMDGNDVGTFVNEPSGEDQWVFNKLVFSNDNMTEGSHNLTVRLNTKSFFIVSKSCLKSCHLSSRPDQFDYLRIISDPSRRVTPPTPPPNPNTTIIAPIVGVVGGVVFIGLTVFWFLHWRGKQGVKVVVPDDSFLPVDHPQGSDSPPAHISPFYVPPQDARTGRTEYNGDQEGTLLLAGAPVTRDRKRNHSQYDVPEAPVPSHLLPDLRESQVASTSSAGGPSRESSPPATLATYAWSTNRESVYSAMTSNYAHTVSENRDLRSAQSTQIVAPIPMPLRPRQFTSPSLSVPPPVQPVLEHTPLYPSAVSAADAYRRRMHSLPPPEI